MWSCRNFHVKAGGDTQGRKGRSVLLTLFCSNSVPGGSAAWICKLFLTDFFPVPLIQENPTRMKNNCYPKINFGDKWERTMTPVCRCGRIFLIQETGLFLSFILIEAVQDLHNCGFVFFLFFLNRNRLLISNPRLLMNCYSFLKKK